MTRDINPLRAMHVRLHRLGLAPNRIHRVLIRLCKHVHVSNVGVLLLSRSHRIQGVSSPNNEAIALPVCRMSEPDSKNLIEGTETKIRDILKEAEQIEKDIKDLTSRIKGEAAQKPTDPEQLEHQAKVIGEKVTQALIQCDGIPVCLQVLISSAHSTLAHHMFLT